MTYSRAILVRIRFSIQFETPVHLSIVGQDFNRSGVEKRSLSTLCRKGLATRSLLLRQRVSESWIISYGSEYWPPVRGRGASVNGTDLRVDKGGREKRDPRNWLPFKYIDLRIIITTPVISSFIYAHKTIRNNTFVILSCFHIHRLLHLSSPPPHTHTVHKAE